MAVKVNWLDAKTYAAKFDRRLIEHLFPSEGVIVSSQFVTPLKVQEQATPAMFVDVLGGDCVIHGDNSSDYGHALFFSDGTATLAIAASDPTNPRIDIVIVRFYDDSTEPGSYGELSVITGTPAASPAVPSTPNNAYKLAEVAVAATVTTITNAGITDKRVFPEFGQDEAITTAKLNIPWANWTPTYSAEGTMTYTSVTTSLAKYHVVGKTCFFQLCCVGTTGGTANYGLHFTLPINAADGTALYFGGGCCVEDGGRKAGMWFNISVDTIRVERYDRAVWGLGTARKIIMQGFYRIA